METLNLTTPINYSSLTVAQLNLDWAGAQIWIELRSANDKRYQYSYTGDSATVLMRALNKADLSVKSLHRRIIERLVADHPELAGAITGAVD